MKKWSDVMWIAVISAVLGFLSLVAAVFEGNLTVGLGLVSGAAAILSTTERR